MRTKEEEYIIKVRTESDKALKELNRLNKEINQISKGVGKSGKSLKVSEKSFAGVTKSVSALNKQLLGLATTYLSFQGAKQLIQTTAELEKGFIGVAKTTGLVGDEFEKLKDGLFDMSTSMGGVTIEGLQSIAEAAGQLGIQSTEDILEFTRVMSMMAISTELSAEEASTAMGKLGVSLGVPIKELENLGSAMNELSATSSSSVSGILEISQRMAGMGTTFGLTSEEILGFSATMEGLGISSQVAGSSINKVMSSMLSDTEAFATVSGQSLSEFSELVKTKPVEALQLFLGELGKLEKTAKVEALDDLGLKSSQVSSTVLKLSANTGILTDNIKISNDAWRKNVSLQNETDIASKGLEAQWDRVTNSVKKLSSGVGEELTPALLKIIDDTVKWIDSLDDESIANFGKAIGGLMDAMTGLWEIGKTLNDWLMPDWLGGEGAGYIDTVAKGLGEVGKRLTEIHKITKAMEDVDKLLGDIEEIENLVTNYDGLAETYKKLSSSLQTLLAENLKLQESFRDNGSEEARLQLEALREEEERIMNLSMELAKQRPMDMTTKSAKAATAAIDNASRSVQKLRKLTINGMTVNVDANTTPAEFGLDKFIVEGEGDDLNVTVTPEWEAAQKEIDAHRKQEEKKPVVLPVKADDSRFTKEVSQSKKEAEQTPATVQVDANTKTADKKIAKSKNEAKKPVESKVMFVPDTRAVDAARRNIARPIKVPVDYVPGPRPASSYASGGPVPLPQRLAVGGIYRGSGKVPGYDPTDSDRVNAKLSGGEYVIKRRAVDHIGVPALNAINSMAVPKGVVSALASIKKVGSFKMPKQVRGYAAGGLVGGTTVTTNTPASPGLGDLGTLTLKVGGNDLQVLAPRAVAEALTTYINSEGGL